MSKKTEERYKSLPPGVRNNNYLNIKKSANKWQGTRLPERNHPFVEFISPEWGYRAAFIIMAKTYRSRGIKTVSEIISAWAPSSENNTAMYIATVMAKLIEWNDWFKCKDFTMPDPNSLHAKYLWIQLASAMTMVEIGKNYWEDFIYKYKGLQHIEKGFDMVFPPEE